jgi:flagellar biosynthetic protein FlhB
MPEGSGGDKSEAPTPRRRTEAREQGNVAKSQDLTAAVGLLSGLLLLQAFGQSIFKQLLDITGLIGLPVIRVGDLVAPVSSTASAVMWMLLPFLLLLMVATIGAILIQHGWVYAPKKMKPDLSKLDPIKGAQQIFSGQALARFVMGLLKLVILGAIAYYVLRDKVEQLLASGGLGALGVLSLGSSMVYDLALKLAIVLLVLAILDFLWARYRHEESLKMTKQEVRDEMKRMDGDPAVKRRQREAQMRIAMQRINTDVPQADVIVTNPTEYAVALRYDEDAMDAPRVVAKGVDLLAARIRQVAQTHGIPIVQRPPLARALYAQCDPGQVVPPALYKAVAEVLAYVYQLTGRAAKAG